MGQQSGQSDTQGKVNPEGLPAAEHLVVARSQFVSNLYFECFYSAALLCQRLGLDSDRHAVVCHALQQTVCLRLDFGERLLFDNQGLNTLLTEGVTEESERVFLFANSG